MKRTGGAYADVNIGLNHRITATTDFAVYFGAKLWGMPSYEGSIDAYSTYDDIISGTMTTCAFYLGANITQNSSKGKSGQENTTRNSDSI